MQTKLTLRLDERLVGKAKRAAKKEGKSVSQMVADFFLLVDTPADPPGNVLPPVTSSLKGLLREKEARQDEYHRYWEKKYR